MNKDLIDYYQYDIDLEYYQIRDCSDIVDYTLRYRNVFKTCLKRCNEPSGRYSALRREQRAGGVLCLYIPKNQALGWMLMTKDGMIQDYNMTTRTRKQRFSQCFHNLVYNCLNRAMDIDLPIVSLWTPTRDMMFNYYMEKLLISLSCEVNVSVHYK